eukprot:CAMPEP_0119083386 /NCGR_PEP_ID=MMETSP1178-20130426/125395_1 /TAXON_ID=33656 /ORGANISM="unid sp, Strain CCMP2000" /LENGTH=51 /DNA_ID=CAMNT_0007066241 /DNA_START=73 /DNA_END=225 /DNA_ORIENTATION=+
MCIAPPVYESAARLGARLAAHSITPFSDMVGSYMTYDAPSPLPAMIWLRRG